MIRKFRPGDRVQLRQGGTTMLIIKYVLDHQMSGSTFSDYHVECVWFENDQRKKQIFDQRTLFKIKHGGGLFEY